MIKKLMSLIFEEEVVDEVEEEPVPVRRSNPAKAPVQPEVKAAVPLPQEVITGIRLPDILASAAAQVNATA